MLPTSGSHSPGNPVRAERFPIHMALRVRTSGETDWMEGETENISRSGLLFRVPRVLEVNSPAELQFRLPVEVGGEQGAMVLALGHVVRTVLPPSSDELPAAAVKFLNYRMLRRDDNGAVA